MLMTSAQFKSLIEPLLIDIFDGVRENLPSEWDKVFKVETARKRRFEEQASLYGLGIATIKPEGKGVTYDMGGEFFRTRFEHVVFALAFALTEELMEDGDHVELGSLYSRYAAKGLEEAKEIYHISILNRAFNSTYKGGDQKPLCTTDHPFARGGGGWSNVLATACDLSEAGLEQMCNQIRLAKDDRGLPTALREQKLLIHPSNRFVAARILRSPGRVGTTNNDANALKELGILQEAPQELTRLTNPKAWFVKTNAERGLIHKKRRQVRRKMEGDFETGSMRFKTDERYSAGWIDPRCIYGTPGV